MPTGTLLARGRAANTPTQAPSCRWPARSCRQLRRIVRGAPRNGRRRVLSRAAEADSVAVTAGLVGQSGEAFEDVGNEQVRLDSAPSTSASWASRSAGCNSPAAIATRARTVSAGAEYQPVVVEKASSAQRRATARSPSASAASALQTRRIAACAPTTTVMCWLAASRACCAAAVSPAARAAYPKTVCPSAANLPPNSAAPLSVASAAARAAAASPWRASAMLWLRG